MISSPSLSDDDALWFPVMSSGSGSFSRPILPEIAPAKSGAQDDDIGLPSRRSRGPKPPKKGGRVAGWLWLTLFGAAALGVVTYAARKELATVAIENWLKGQGVESPHLRIDALGLNHASGQLYIGEQTSPEFSIGKFDFNYSLNLFTDKGQPLARVTSIRLSRPLVQFSYKNGKLDFGSLDKLIQSALTAPPSDAPPPESIVIDDATVRVVTDYGLVRGHGGLALQDGQLIFARVEMPSADLSGPLGSGKLKRGVVTAKSIGAKGPGDQLHVQGRLEADDWEMRSPDPVDSAEVTPRPTNLQDITVDIDSFLPYRKAKSVSVAYSGPTEHTVAFKAGGIQTPDADLGGVEANLHLKGDLKTTEKGASFSGEGWLLSRAETLMNGEIDSRDLRLDAQKLAISMALVSGAPLELKLTGPLTGRAGIVRQNDLFLGDAALNLAGFQATVNADGFSSTFSGGLTAGRVAAGDIAVNSLTASLAGKVDSSSATGAWGVEVRSDVASDQGSYGGLKIMADARVKAAAIEATRPPIPGAPNPPPPDAVVMLDRALSRFSLRARGLVFSASGTAQAGAPSQFSLTAGRPIELGLTGGGKAIVTPVAAKPLLASTRTGAFGLSVSGPDLPTVTVAADKVGLTDNGLLAANYKAAADFDFFPVSGGHFEGQGGFAMTPEGGIVLTLSQPATVTAKSAVLGDYFTDVSLSLSQAGPRFLALDNKGGFRVTAAYSALSLNAPNLLARLDGGSGPLEAFSIPGAEAVGLKLALTGATFSDALSGAEQRFNPLLVTGTLDNTAKALTGRFLASVKSTGRKVADVHLDNDNLTARGGLSFTTADYLTFDPEGLQPVELSPLVAAIFSSDVTGKAKFDGAINWDGMTSTSGGLLTLDGLDYTGATGLSKGMNGRIAFTSLAPMRSDPAQVICIDSMDVGVPLRDMRLSLQFLGETIALESAQVQSPGGPLILEPAVLPLDGKSEITGAVKFDGLDFGKIIAATDLAASMSFQGKLSGRLPFRLDKGRINIADGFMKSDSEGMISIRRTSVTGVAATGSVTATDPNAPAALPPEADPNFNPFQDLAFQAMEWLHYDEVSARLNTIPGGKLNINFHIKGRFIPPQHQEAKIGLIDYITGKWMTKPIKLPSDTPVELYLEVPLNLDEILDDLTAFNTRAAAR